MFNIYITQYYIYAANNSQLTLYEFVKQGAHRPLTSSLLAFGRNVDMCVCPPLRLFITSGVKRTLYDWLNKFYNLYMVAIGDISIVGIAS